MIKTVNAVPKTRNMHMYVCCPNALKASSGPYDEDERPSDPRPIHASNGIKLSLWKNDESFMSRGLPMRA
jgi:hypothetical protein